MRCDRIWVNARIASLDPALPGLGIIEDAAIAARGDTIAFVGPMSEAGGIDAAQTIDCERRWITPGLVDCHTHLVYAGNRSREFEQRLAGATYEEIARNGGGIASTVRQTRAATPAELLAQSSFRLDAMIAEGVTTVEIKSGYGLSLDDEMKQLSVARELGRQRPVTVVTTFLGAHTKPPERDGDRYIDEVCDVMLPRVANAGLADAVDVFCETVGFTLEQSRKVLQAAGRLGLPVKMHAEQLSASGAAKLAASCGALSADHLEHLDDAGAAAMAAAGTTAVLLPGAFYFLKEKIVPPVDLLRRYAIPIAIATDCNPGTSPLTSPLLAMNMAATLFGLTVPECIAGMTRHAARALGMLDKTGTLEPGKFCDLAIWNIEAPAELVYRIGQNPLHERVWRGT